MSATTHQVEIVRVILEPHPNADALSIVKIEGYQAIVRTTDFRSGGLGAYIQPDSLVPVDRPEFAFLADPKHPEKTMVRTKARRLRGEWSMGLLIPAPPDAVLGDDVAERLGVKHYDPPEPNAKTGGECDVAPRAEGWVYPTYDVEAFRKYGRVVFEEGEPVYVTEKIHGANGRWLFDGDRFHCGSHTTWKRYDVNNLWWRALIGSPALENFLTMNPGTAVYGEVYGQVQDLKYGTARGEIKVAVFDILHEGRWVDAADLQSFQPNPNGPPASTLPWVPLIASCEFEFNLIIGLADGKSLVPDADHVREGIVVKPMQERWHPKCGRVNLKVVSNFYYERVK